ncbi:MAG: hypothetical protein ACKO9V_07930, partial [Candidatus Kapaibacterium sp.]
MGLDGTDDLHDFTFARNDHRPLTRAVRFRRHVADLLRDAGERYRLVTVGPSVLDSAIQLTRRQKLRGYDAIHLACALALNKPLADDGLPPL